MSALRCLILTLVFLASTAATAEAGFGLLPGEEGFSISFLRAAGKHEEAETLGGSHPFDVRASFRFNSQGGRSDGDLREMRVDLPPGLIGNPLAIGRCSEQQLETPRSSPFAPSSSGESCPGISQVGVVTLVTDRDEGKPRTFGVFN